MRDVPQFSDRGSGKFREIVSSFLLQPGLPFAEILSAERIERIFRKHGNLFGVGGIYSVAVMLWSFLGQVLRDGKDASCQAAVARIVTFKNQHGELAPTSDTGDYCRARSKLSGGKKVAGTKFTNIWPSVGSSRDFQAKSPRRLGEPRIVSERATPVEASLDMPDK